MADKLTKQDCINMAPKNWTYVGLVDGFYMYQSGNYSDGFYEMRCLSEDMENGNLQYMADHKLTRSEKHYNPK